VHECENPHSFARTFVPPVWTATLLGNLMLFQTTLYSE